MYVDQVISVWDYDAKLVVTSIRFGVPTIQYESNRTLYQGEGSDLLICNNITTFNKTNMGAQATAPLLPCQPVRRIVLKAVIALPILRR